MRDLIGGPDRDRTDDLFHAMEARSQLRHRPTMLVGQLFYFRRLGWFRQPSVLLVCSSKWPKDPNSYFRLAFVCCAEVLRYWSRSWRGHAGIANSKPASRVQTEWTTC